MKTYAKHRWFALFAFFLFEMVHNADKLMIGPLTTPIMKTFAINEAQMGAVTTAALLVGMALFPIWGYLYDHYARPKLLALASFIWGLTTMLNTRAPTYPAFMVTRASTGIDDSSYSGLESMVSDFFEPRLRSKAYGILAVAPSIGYLLAMILTITLEPTLGWRNLYFITGTIGILVAVLIFFGVKDPPRGSSEPEMAEAGKSATVKFSWTSVKGIFGKKTMVFLLLQGFFGVIPWQVLVFWIFRYLETERGFESIEILTTMVGVILVISIGYLSAGAIGDFAFRRNVRGRLIVSSLGMILGFIFLELALQTSLQNHASFSILLIIGAFFMTFAAPQTPATIGDIILPEIRSTAISIQYLFQNSGAAMAPLLAGMIAVRSDLGQAMAIVGYAWVFSSILAVFSAYYVKRDHALLRQQMQERASPNQ
jgi:MFS transporter, Spinster family, sphingosine-1-phosphate transporter